MRLLIQGFTLNQRTTHNMRAISLSKPRYFSFHKNTPIGLVQPPYGTLNKAQWRSSHPGIVATSKQIGRPLISLTSKNDCPYVLRGSSGLHNNFNAIERGQKRGYSRSRSDSNDYREHTFKIGATLGVLTIYFTQKTYFNDVLHNRNLHILRPVARAETFENGLYQASKLEEERLKEEYRERQSKRSYIIGLIFRLKFVLDDYLVEPIVTFARFLELTILFLPLLLAAPMCWLGPRDKTSLERTRAGALLWFRYLRWTAEVAGASFIKLSQWAASRTDIFPRQLCVELSQLHSSASPHSLSQTKKIVAASFGMPFDEIFTEFNETPVGVGAIAQVYLAKLSEKAISKAREDENNRVQLSLDPESHGEEAFWESMVVTEQLGKQISSHQEVAIKVLHPNVEVKIHRDLRVMLFFANLIDLIPTMEWLSLPDEVEQFGILMQLQLDLRIEALNLAKFRDNFRNRLDIHFPKPFLSFSTREVLVEEYINAIPMAKMLSLNDNFGKNLSKEISDKGLDAFLQMLILDNFVHADLHPGNMLVRFYKNELYKHEKEYKIVKSSNEAETNRITQELLALGDDNEAWCKQLNHLYESGYHAEICFLDVGLITELNHVDRVNFIDLFKALSEFDGYKAGELMVERSRTPDMAINKELFALKVEKLVDRIKERTFTLGNVSIGDLLDQVLSMVRMHHVRMEGDFITVVVAILLLEGIGRQLDPQLDLFARYVLLQLVALINHNLVSD